MSSEPMRLPTYGTLRDAGFERGDFLPLYNFTPNADFSVSFTTTSYDGNWGLSYFSAVWDQLFPPSAKTHVYASIRLNSLGAGETVSLRLRNMTDAENLGEITGITSEGMYSIDTDYEPPTTGSVTRYRWEWKEDPGANSSTVEVPIVCLGVVV